MFQNHKKMTQTRATLANWRKAKMCTFKEVNFLNYMPMFQHLSTLTLLTICTPRKTIRDMKMSIPVPYT